MSSTFQPPPTYALPVIVEETTGKAIFNPVWIKWFIDLTAGLQASGAGSGDVVGPGGGAVFGDVAIFGDNTGKTLIDGGALGTLAFENAASSDVTLAQRSFGQPAAASTDVRAGTGITVVQDAQGFIVSGVFVTSDNILANQIFGQ